MGPPAARIGDMHLCPMVTPGTPPIPHVGGPVVKGEPTVLTGMSPQARIGDMCTCVGPPDSIVMGSVSVIVGKSPAARIGDSTAHGGAILLGCFTVLIGGAGAGASGGSVTVFGLTIQGDADFRAKTIAALVEIAKTPSGQAMLRDIAAARKPITIVPTTGGNEVTGFGAAARRNADGTPGAGTGSTVHFNPDKGVVGDGSEAWQTRPVGIGLGHELVHATHAARGEIDFTKVQNDHKPDPTDPSGYNQYYAEEVRTAGIPPHNTDAYNENSMRKEWDPPQPARPYY